MPFSDLNIGTLVVPVVTTVTTALNVAMSSSRLSAWESERQTRGV